MVATLSRLPPKFLMLMLESVLFSSDRVPTCVGLRIVGGGRRVCLGSQSMALAVVRRDAMARGEGGAVDGRDALRGGADTEVEAVLAVECSVLRRLAGHRDGGVYGRFELFRAAGGYLNVSTTYSKCQCRRLCVEGLTGK